MYQFPPTMRALQTLHHCVFDLSSHLVLVTKDRRRCLTAELLEELRGHFARLLSRWGCELTEFNGEPDHVHLLLRLHPAVKPSVLVNGLKTVSSRLLRRDHGRELRRHIRGPVLWSRSYCLVSSGDAPLDMLRAYIETK